MSVSMGDIALILSTNAVQLFSGLGGASKGIKDFLGGTLLAAGGAFAGAEAIKSITDNIDRLHRSKLDADTLGVSAEAFQGLSANAKRFGVEGSTLNTMLEKFAAHVSDAMTKGGTFADTLKDIGVNLNDLRGRDVIEQFKVVADSLSKIEDRGKRASAAQAIFAKQFAGMLPLLSQGSSGIQSFTDRMAKLGVALNSADMEKISRAKESMENLDNSLEGLKNKLTISLAPLIESISDKFANWVERSTPQLNKLREYLDNVVKILIALGDQVEVWGSQFASWMSKNIGHAKEFDAAMSNSEQNTLTVAKNIAYALTPIGVMIGYLKDLWKGFQGLVEEAAGGMVRTFAGIVQGLAYIAQNYQTGSDLKKFAEEQTRIGQMMSYHGRKMQREAGEGLTGAFGKARGQVDQWFANVFKHQDKVEEKAAAMGKAMAEAMTPPKYVANNPLTSGSSQLYSKQLEMNFGGKNKNEQAELQKEANKKLDTLKDILEAIKRIAPLPIEVF